MVPEVGSHKLFFSVLIILLSISCAPEKSREYVLKGKTVFVVTPGEDRESPPVARTDTSYLEHVYSAYDLVDIATLDSTIRVRLQYADTTNFLHTNLYDGLKRAYMTCDLAIRLCNAQRHLKAHDSTLSLAILDAARPMHIQQIMWDSLNLRPELKRKYLSPPESASLHNYGCALDLTIVDGYDEPLDMGSEFDEFDRISQPRFEQVFSASGQLDSIALANRKLLRHVMTVSGLKGISTEWWHFSLCTRQEAVARYELIR